jgi:hypothetical protein
MSQVGRIDLLTGGNPTAGIDPKPDLRRDGRGQQSADLGVGKPANHEAMTILFYDLVGAGEYRWRDRQTQRFGGIKIYHQLENRRLLDRQIGRFGAFENSSSIDASLAKDGCVVNSIADQTAGRDERAARIYRRNGVAVCQVTTC